MTRNQATTIIDMTPEGGFADPPRAGFRLLSTGTMTLVAVGSVAILAMVLAVWLAITILPVLLGVMLCSLLIARLRARRRLRAGFIVRRR